MEWNGVEWSGAELVEREGMRWKGLGKVKGRVG